MRRAVLCVLMGFVFQVQAAERIWSGGSSGNWSVPENWSPVGVPENGDRLVFDTGSGTLNNDLTDLSVSGLAFGGSAGAYTLDGNRVTVGGITNASASAQIFNLPVGIEETAIFHGTGGSMRFNAEISGSGSLSQTGPGPVLLYATNTFTGNYLVKTQACVRVYSSEALGSTQSGQVVIEDFGWIEFNNQIEISRVIDIRATTESSNHAGAIRAMSGRTTFRALVKSNRSRVSAASGHLVFAEGMSGNALYTGGAYPYEIVFAKPLVLTSVFFAHGTSVKVFEVQGNTWGRTEAQDGGVILCRGANVLPADKDFLGWGIITLDLNGFDQTIARLWGNATGPKYIVSTNAPATLTVNQGSDGVLPGGQFTGKAGLLKLGNGALILSGDQQSVGPFVVEAGKLVVSNMLATCTNVTVRGGSLELVRDPKMAATSSFEITSSVPVTLGEQTTVGTFIVDGATMPAGTYGSAESPAATKLANFSGKGYIVVKRAAVPITSQAVWDAGGGSDTSAANPANWAGDVLPTLDESTSVNFTAGTTATFENDVTVGAIEFNTGAAFLINGAGRVELGQGGVQVKNHPAAVTYTLQNDLHLIADQTWFVTNSANAGQLTVVAVKGRMSNIFAISETLRLTGPGVYSLYGDSSFVGSIALAGSNTCAHVYHSRAFGDARVAVTNFALIRLYGGLTISNQFSILHYFGRGNYSTIRSETGTNTLAGAILTGGSPGGRLSPGGSTSPMIVSGGVTGGSLYTDASLGGGYILFTNKPINITGVLYVHSTGDRILAVPGNTWSSYNINDNGQWLVCAVSNALPPNTGYDTGRANLNIGGFNQTIGRIKSVSLGLPQLIASPTPAILTINQTTSELFRGQFTNAIGIVKQGAGTLTLTNAYHFFSGPMTVREGQLDLLAGASLGAACTNLTVSGGILSAASNGAWSRNAFVSLAGTGKLQLAAATRQEALQLFVNGTLQPSGTYGSSSSTAQHVDDVHFSGTGVLYVRRGYPATRLILR